MKTKTIKLLALVFLILNLGACGDDIFILPGVVQGGGGYLDSHATPALLKIKDSLAEIIAASSDELYVNFPEGQGKEYLADLVRRLDFGNTVEDRILEETGHSIDLIEDTIKNNNKVEYIFRYRKADELYSKDVIYATQYFVKAFPFGRVESMEHEDIKRIIYETFLDIMHEASHLYGIGIENNDENQDSNSEKFASDFLFKSIAFDTFDCLSEKTISDSSDNKIRLRFHNPFGWALVFDSTDQDLKSAFEGYTDSVFKNSIYYTDLSVADFQLSLLNKDLNSFNSDYEKNTTYYRAPLIMSQEDPIGGRTAVFMGYYTDKFSYQFSSTNPKKEYTEESIHYALPLDFNVNTTISKNDENSYLLNVKTTTKPQNKELNETNSNFDCLRGPFEKLNPIDYTVN